MTKVPQSHPLGRATHSQAFREVVSLITGFSLVLNPLSPALWTGRLGLMTLGRLVSLILAFSSPYFDKLSPVKREIEDKFA